MLTIDRSFLLDVLLKLLETPSPSGFTAEAMERVEQALAGLGFTPRRTNKGAALADWMGASASTPRGIVAHVDTLGAMVKEIKPSGRLRLAQVGQYAWNTIEGEGVTVFCYNGRRVRGSVLCTQASNHIYGSDSEELRRSDETLEVRLDEPVHTAAQSRALGVEVGDLVAFDPRPEVSENGYIRSRHLDDKAGVACVLAALQAMRLASVSPAQRTTIMITNYEEVSHGAVAGLPPDLAELVAVDMAVVGDGQTSDEHHVTVCALDSGGPYDPALTARLRHLGESLNLPLRIDTYPHYRSDAQTVWRTPADVRVALLGPGIDASHNYERTHLDALVATAQLIIEYLRS
ncbi:MAG: M42 family metallopeptidase [Anaerolineales bacterium]|nr:M42 family metallopeptidase [Anaerolineales bacterium]